MDPLGDQETLNPRFQGLGFRVLNPTLDPKPNVFGPFRVASEVSEVTRNEGVEEYTAPYVTPPWVRSSITGDRVYDLGVGVLGFGWVWGFRG